jgi:prevent-host-death family protein
MVIIQNEGGVQMKQVPAGEFKARCLKLMDLVHDTHEEITITKFGKPVARLVPIDKSGQASKPLFGSLKGTVIERGDIVAPIGEAWDVE